MNEFKTGDIVVLKSGSVTMTISSIKDDRIECRWYDVESNSFKLSHFNPQVLNLHKE